MRNLKPFVNNTKLWDDFVEELEERILKSYKAMAQMDDLNEIYRMQGEIRALNKLRQLKEKVNNG